MEKSVLILSSFTVATLGAEEVLILCIVSLYPFYTDDLIHKFTIS